MCGVTAIYAYHPDAPSINESEFLKVCDAQRSRGPDGLGTWISADRRLGLAHTRLAVLDLHDRAAQPMQSLNGRYSIIFNGEIYNYVILRQELEKKGHRFRTNSDTEVLLRLYEESGEGMLDLLRGMYAFIIWDDVNKRMFMARDPYGIKPLYYAEDGKTIRIASQVKALLTGGAVDDRIDPAGLCGFYLLGSIPEPFTIYNKIKELPAGTCMSVDYRGIKTRRFSAITEIFASPSTELHKDQIRHAINDSVAAHLVSDVPVAVYLSAGIDSGALLGIMRDLHSGPIDAITLEFEAYHGTLDDEAPLAEKVADHYGAVHHRYMVGGQEAKTVMEDFVTAMDQPSIDGLNTYLVSRFARSLGVKVALSGVGGDELFGGYPSFRDVPRWAKLPEYLKRFADPWHKVVNFCRKGLDLNPKIAGLLEYGGTWPGAYLLRRGLFMPWELQELVGSDIAEEGLRKLDLFSLLSDAVTPEPRTNYGHVAALESSFYLRNQLLRDTDWAGMANSVEIRTPWVDHRLSSVVAPALATNGGVHGKELLAKAPSRQLPESVSKRRKTGFTVPLARWLESSLFDDSWKRIPMLRSRSCHWARRWAYTVASPLFAV